MPKFGSLIDLAIYVCILLSFYKTVEVNCTRSPAKPRNSECRNHSGIAGSYGSPRESQMPKKKTNLRPLEVVANVAFTTDMRMSRMALSAK